MTVQKNLRLEEARPLDQGMGVAVGRRTVFRESDNEDMGHVADRVASGNLALTGTDPDYLEELTDLRNMIARGALPTSGRHLQHGDLDQKHRNMEVFTNCSSAALSFPKFYLLLNGSGVGRNYSDDMMVVNWANSAHIITLLSEDHPDYPTTDKQLFQFAKDFGFLNFKFEDGKMIPPRWADFTDEVRQKVIKYRNEKIPTAEPQQDLGRVLRHTVDDSREGWAKALELVEAVAHSGTFDTILLDFSQVRENGAPIAGMQNRPASGPLSVMRAFININDQVVPRARRGEIDMWEQAMIVDHLFSVEVQVGGARRAARMAVKYWKDKGIFQFIRIKAEGGLWTSNNSVGVDQEFWDYINWIRQNGMDTTMPLSEDAQWAWQVFLEATECAFINGEPGFISLDKLESNKTGKGRERPIYTDGRDFGSQKYQATVGSDLLAAVAEKAMGAKYPMIVNPCVTGDTWVQTDQGLRQVKDLVGVPFNALVDGQSYASNGFWETGVKEVFRVKTDRGYEVRATGNHEFLVRREKHTEWVEAQDLREDDQVVVNGDNGSFLDQEIAKVTEVVDDGVEPVYDCTVEQVHCYSANGLIVHNCGEVELHTLGGYCVIGDVAPLLACPFDYNGELSLTQKSEWDNDAEQSVRLMVRFLMRVNLMDALYGEEVQRTNRIGVSLTGIHEWAYARFGYTFYDLIDESRSQDFWNLVKRLSDAAKEEAEVYAGVLGVEVPHTIVTIKPAGTTSKLYGLSEGAHLPAMRQYLRWVQYRGQKDAHGEWPADADPLLAHYEKLGYPIQELETFPGMSIVGFPTVPLVCYLMSQEEIVTANEATPEEQYKWLMLLEKYWLGENRGNQVSYTMKIYTTDHSLEDYRRICAEYQSQIRACALMPQVPDSHLGFEYLPEQEVSLERFEDVVENIAETARTDIDMDTLECASGACPI